MPYIKVNPSALSSMSEMLWSSSSRVSRIGGDFSSAARRLDWDVRSASGIQRRIDRINSALEEQARMLEKMRSFIGDARSKYASVQNAYSGGGKSGGAGSTRSFAARTEKSWFDSVEEAFRSAIGDLKNGICAGASAIANNLSDCRAYWVDNWNNKGWVYKAVKATGAVVSIVGSAAVVVSAIGSAIASGGLTVPVAAAILLTMYNGNSIANRVADLCNLFGGDIDQVGKTNLLKTACKWVGGKAGELAGYKEAGEKAGEIVYTIGSVGSTVLSLQAVIGKVKQTDALELGNSAKSAFSAIKNAWTQNAAAAFEEVKYAASGLGYIAAQAPIHEVGMQICLLKGELSILTPVMKQVGVISKAVGEATKLIDAGIDVINLSNEAGFPDVPSDLLPEKILKPGEVVETLETIAGIPANDSSVIEDFKKANVAEGVKSIQEIVDGLVDAREAWDFVARTST